MPSLVFLIFLWPVLEIMALAYMVSNWGFLNTLAYCLLTALWGLTLIRRHTARLTRHPEMGDPREDARVLFAKLLAALLLILPGPLSDLFAVLLLVPWGRRILMGAIPGARHFSGGASGVNFYYWQFRNPRARGEFGEAGAGFPPIRDVSPRNWPPSLDMDQKSK